MKLKFIGTYGCSCEAESIALEADTIEEAENYVHLSAIESYESFAGFDGIQNWEDVANEYNGLSSYDIDSLYNEIVENDIFYMVEEFDYDNQEHIDILTAQEGDFWEV